MQCSNPDSKGEIIPDRKSKQIPDNHLLMMSTPDDYKY